MQGVYLGVIAGLVDDCIFAAAKSSLNFISYAQYSTHTMETLDCMGATLDTFHANKDAFINAGVCEHFNISKLHNILHYIDSICSLGSTDSFNIKHPKQLHINYAKNAYWHVMLGNGRVLSISR